MNEKEGSYIDRKRAADQIRRARENERAPDHQEDKYKIERTGREFLFRMGGLKHFFDYLRTVPPYKVLDIGTGNGRAMSVISKMDIAHDLSFEVTALHRTPELDEAFSKEQIHLTSTDVLRGIEDRTFSGVTGVNSIAYSNPLLSVPQIDRILVPGGTVKATFRVFGESNPSNFDFKNPMAFLAEFAKRGYDVAFRDSAFLRFDSPTDLGRYQNSILLAIKPGNTKAPKAQELLDADHGIFDLEKEGELNGQPIVNIEDF